MKLCKHVAYSWSGSQVRVTDGAAAPIFGWSGELQADVPLLKCSACDASALLVGAEAVFVNRSAWHDRKATTTNEDEDEDEEMEWETPHTMEGQG